MGTLKVFMQSIDIPDEDLPSLLLIESIANSIDSHAGEIDIQLGKSNAGNYYLKITDNGEGMSRNVFENSYHKFSSSSKTKGEGIGFAGVGAKLCFYFSNKTVVKTTTIGPDGPLCSSMWWNDSDKEIKWSYLDESAVESTDLNRLREYRNGTVYKVEIDYKTYNYLYNNYKRIIHEWYNSILLGLYPLTITFGGKPIEPEAFKVAMHKEVDIKVMGSRFHCHFYLLEEELPANATTKLGFNFVVYGKYIKTDSPEQTSRIKPEFINRLFVIVLADDLAKYLNFSKQGFRPGTKLYGAARRMVEVRFFEWLKTIGALKEEEEILSADKDMTLLGQVLQAALQKDEFKAFNPYIRQVTQSVLFQSASGELVGDRTNGSQLVPGTIGAQGEGKGTKVIGEEEPGTSMVQGQGNVPMEQRERKTKSFVIKGKNAKDDPREAWVDPADQWVIINTAHPFYLTAQDGNSAIRWMQQLKAVVDALAYYKAEEIFANDYKKGSDLKQKLCDYAWEAMGR
jgi:hypothetical protein